MAMLKESHIVAPPKREAEQVRVNSHYGYEFCKRAFDILFSLLFILLGFPFIILCAILMQLESKGRMFYFQDRVGRDGNLFTVMKLRSMPENSEANGPVIMTVEHDPRLGKIGRFIRKSKIDELPQFLNVLKGEMSVIGPRPERPYFIQKFESEHPNIHLRHRVKPGITGLAQIKEKDSLEIRSKLRYDLHYITHRSFSYDMWILWHTVWFCFHYLLVGMGLRPNGNGNGGHNGLSELT